MIHSDSLTAYPDILTISIPTEVTLAGILILSGEDGWILEYTVETYNGTSWTTVADIGNATSPIQLIYFPGPVMARKVRINVTQDQPGVNNAGEYTRIHEVYPLFATASSSASSTSGGSSASSSTSTSATDKSTSKKHSNAGAIAAGVIGGVVAAIIVVLAGFLTFRKRWGKGEDDLPEQNSQEFYPLELASGHPHPAENTYEPAGETEHSAAPTELGHRATRNFDSFGITTGRPVHEKPAELANRTSQNMQT